EAGFDMAVEHRALTLVVALTLSLSATCFGRAARQAMASTDECSPQWHATPSPDVGELGLQATYIDGTSPSDAWMVGSHYVSGRNVPLVEHWDGSSWKLASSPDLFGMLFAVDALAYDDAWAVGGLGAL